MKLMTASVEKYLDARTIPILAADTYSRDVLRSVADQLTVLAEHHGDRGSDDHVAAANTLDDYARQLLALVGEVTFERDGDAYDATDPRV